MSIDAVRIVAVAAVGRAARRLDERHLPRLRSERAQKRVRVVGAGAFFAVESLAEHAAVVGPKILQAEDQLLESLGGRRTLVAHGAAELARDFRSRRG